MSFKLFFIPAIVASVLYGFAMASIASAEVTVTVDTWESTCDLVDGSVECDVHSYLGISHVHVFLNTGVGDVTVFDKDYAGCPTDVHISLDPIVLQKNAEMEVTTCGTVIPCDDCSAEICIDDSCKELPPVGVGRPDPLPLKNPARPAIPPVFPGVYVSPR